MIRPVARRAILAAAGAVLIARGAAAQPLDPPRNEACRPGPVAWKEEYWDIKPASFDAFLKAYREQVYQTARQVPGYRGYTVMTVNAPPAAPQPGGPPQPLAGVQIIQPHYGVTLLGVKTERSIDVGRLMARTHNVIVSHSFATWADAERFQARFATRYAAGHAGADGWAQVAKRLFPMANNYWETYYRLVCTGYPGASRGADADGLDLSPRPEPSHLVKEYWDVEPAKLQAFVKAYQEESYPTIRQAAGNWGMTILTRLPPGPGEAPMTAYARRSFPLGGPDAFYVSHPGVLMDGAVKTDISVNFSALFKPAYSVIIYHHRTGNSEPLRSDVLQRIYGAQHGGADRTARVARYMFPYADNHWDMSYSVVETSFAATAAP